MGHAAEALISGKIKRAMIIGKGSLFLGRLTNLADGASFLMEMPVPGKTEGEKGVTREEIREMILEALGNLRQDSRSKGAERWTKKRRRGN